ncbi:hypothetical protein H5P28_05635 [Ruficoccus amylovorans]|uniref:CobW/HypB/UreG nucleotide-binding domain-containing protein n=1 Tax=Ruficoccus amylovorans TaxID=1804625 RepID=A0A842HBV6_9BACT|nr:hypothetical protein [Ruficoccus amylovorans]MBC2593740.1 hypothetical protein [Ruficoccus amylovorans]
MTEVYLILGTPGSGRREIVFDLIDDGLPSDQPVNVILSSTEAESPEDERLAALPQVELIEREDSGLAPAPDAGAVVFYLADGSADFRDEIETFKRWLDSTGAVLQRVITVIDCALAEQHAALAPWFEALIHFSDCVLLNRRENVGNKWIRDFEQSFKKRHFPCLFEMVKKGRVANPPQILHPEPRRLSHVFDDLDAIDSLELDDEELPDEIIDLTPKADAYLVRLPSGHREIALPDIREHLPSPESEA